MKPRLTKPSAEEDQAIDAGMAQDPDTFEIDANDFKALRPAQQAHPQLVEAYRKRQGERGPQKAPIKARVTIRLDAEVAAFFKEAGEGWQTRLNQVLKDYVRDQQR